VVTARRSSGRRWGTGLVLWRRVTAAPPVRLADRKTCFAGPETQHGVGKLAVLLVFGPGVDDQLGVDHDRVGEINAVATVPPIVASIWWVTRCRRKRTRRKAMSAIGGAAR